MAPEPVRDRPELHGESMRPTFWTVALGIRSSILFFNPIVSLTLS